MANGNPDVSIVGIRIPRYRRRKITDNPTINSGQDGKPVHINRRDYDRTDGSCIAVQIGPNQTVTTTHDVIGLEVRARTTAVGSGGITAIKAEPTATTATDTIGSVRAFEANITVNGTRTVTSDISAFRAFLDVAASVTVTGKKSVIQVGNENQSSWDYFLNSETGAGIHDLTSGTYTTAEGALLVRIAGSDYRIPFFTAAD